MTTELQPSIPSLATLFRPTGNAWLTDTMRELVIATLLSERGWLGQHQIAKELQNAGARAYLEQMARMSMIQRRQVGRRIFYGPLHACPITKEEV